MTPVLGTKQTHRWLQTTLISISLTILASCAPESGAPSRHLPDEPLSEAQLTALEGGEVLSLSQNLELKSLRAPSYTESEKISILSNFDYVDPTHLVPTDLLEKALLYYNSNQAQIPNKRYLSVIDFSKRSDQSRLFIINMSTGAVWALHVAHGKGSDTNHDGYAEQFGNTPNSNMSSLGFYRTAETYDGNNGLSLRLDGLSSTNSNARKRAVVVHGAAYVHDENVIQGRSSGCPAVPMEHRNQVISYLKGGSIIYAGLSN